MQSPHGYKWPFPNSIFRFFLVDFQLDLSKKDDTMMLGNIEFTKLIAVWFCWTQYKKYSNLTCIKILNNLVFHLFNSIYSLWCSSNAPRCWIAYIKLKPSPFGVLKTYIIIHYFIFVQIQVSFKLRDKVNIFVDLVPIILLLSLDIGIPNYAYLTQVFFHLRFFENGLNFFICICRAWTFFDPGYWVYYS